MKHLGISGGGTKIGGLFGAAEVILKEKNYQPDIISGVSSGAILSVPLAMGKFDELRKLVLDFDLKTFFSTSPVKSNGKIRVANAILSIVSGRPYLGKQLNLEKALAALVPVQEFEEYKRDDKYPICIVGSVDFYTGCRVFVNLKEMSHQYFLRFVNASASIPIFTEGIKVTDTFHDFTGKKFDDEVLLYDGGVRDHISTPKIIGSDKYSITESTSIYSRPEDYKKVLAGKFIPKNLMKILSRYTDISNVEVSKNDEFMENKIMKEKGIKKHKTIFLPSIMQDVYDVDKGRLKQMYEAGKLQAKDWDANAASLVV